MVRMVLLFRIQGLATFIRLDEYIPSHGLEGEELEDLPTCHAADPGLRPDECLPTPPIPGVYLLAPFVPHSPSSITSKRVNTVPPARLARGPPAMSSRLSHDPDDDMFDEYGLPAGRLDAAGIEGFLNDAGSDLLNAPRTAARSRRARQASSPRSWVHPRRDLQTPLPPNEPATSHPPRTALRVRASTPVPDLCSNPRALTHRIPLHLLSNRPHFLAPGTHLSPIRPPPAGPSTAIPPPASPLPPSTLPFTPLLTSFATLSRGDFQAAMLALYDQQLSPAPTSRGPVGSVSGTISLFSFLPHIHYLPLPSPRVLLPFVCPFLLGLGSMTSQVTP